MDGHGTHHADEVASGEHPGDSSPVSQLEIRVHDRLHGRLS